MAHAPKHHGPIPSKLGYAHFFEMQGPARPANFASVFGVRKARHIPKRFRYPSLRRKCCNFGVIIILQFQSYAVFYRELARDIPKPKSKAQLKDIKMRCRLI